MEESSYKESSPTTIRDSLSPPLREASASGAPRKPRRLHTFLRKIGDEWSGFLGKIRESTHISYSDEEAIDSLFESSDEDIFERTRKWKRFGALTAAEVAFMNQHSKGAVPEQPGAAEAAVLAAGNATQPGVPAYQDLNMTGLRTQYADSEKPGSNIGQSLWEIRRGRWLTPAEAAEPKTAEPSRLPRELYPRVYNELIEKATPLRKGKRIALPDLVNVMNVGWHTEKVWERASKGLP